MNEYEVVITFAGQILPVRINADSYEDAVAIAHENVSVEVLDLNDPGEQREAA